MKTIKSISKLLKRIIVFVLIILVVSFAVSFVFTFLNRYLVVSKPLAHADAIVLMAGDDKDRLPAFVGLYKNGLGKKILLVNDGILGAWSTEFSRNLYLVEWTRLELIKHGIPKSDIVILQYTQSGTFYDALNTKKFVQANDLSNIAVLTSDYHTKRTLWSFEKVFAESTVKIGVYPSSTNCSASDSGSYIEKFITLIYEFFKLNFYKIRFGFQ